MSNFISNHVDYFTKTANSDGSGSGALLRYGFNSISRTNSNNNDIVRLPRIKHIGEIIRFVANDQMELRCELGTGSNMSINGVVIQSNNGETDGADLDGTVVIELEIGATNKEYGFCIATSLTNWNVQLFDHSGTLPTTDN